MTVTYQSISEILADLDAQQRAELAALAATADARELNRRRKAKRRLSDISRFFIEQTWNIIATDLGDYSLEEQSGKSEADIRAHLGELQVLGPAYAWGWVRARMDERVVRLLELCVPELLNEYPKEAEHYRKCLHYVGHYWFRESPQRHLHAGYHTALGVACKWYGSAFELQVETGLSSPSLDANSLRLDLRRFASFSMTMLARTDGYLWDSANSRPLDAVLEDGALCLTPRVIAEIDLESTPDYGLRLGCPALCARHGNGATAFDGIISWVEAIFLHYLGDSYRS